MSNGYLETNLEFLKDASNLKDTYCIVEDVTINGTTGKYSLVFKHVERTVTIEQENLNVPIPGIKIDSFVKHVSADLNMELYSFDSYSILIQFLKKNSLRILFNNVDTNLDDMKLEKVTSNVRYYDIISSLGTNGIDNIKTNLERLSRLVVPVVELGLGLRCNNYDHLNDYLILDNLDCEIDTQLINDSQAVQLLELQRLLEEYNVKENGVTPLVYSKIKYCIPAYFKVTLHTKQA